MLFSRNPNGLDYLLSAVICDAGAKIFLVGLRRWDCSILMSGLMWIPTLSCVLCPGNAGCPLFTYVIYELFLPFSH